MNFGARMRNVSG